MNRCTGCRNITEIQFKMAFKHERTYHKLNAHFMGFMFIKLLKALKPADLIVSRVKWDYQVIL